MNEIEFLEWVELSKHLKDVKQKELTLRKKLCNEMFSSNTNKVILDEFDYEFTAKQSFNHNIQEDVLKTIWPVLSGDERNVIKFKPVLKEESYKKLSITSVIHEAITKTSGTPTLKLKVIKK
jgi:hypothetical protein